MYTNIGAIQFCHGILLSEYFSNTADCQPDCLSTTTKVLHDNVPAIALNELNKSIPVMIILNICTLDPLIHIMNRFIGIDFAGASAMSHDFYDSQLSKPSISGPLFTLSFRVTFSALLDALRDSS